MSHDSVPSSQSPSETGVVHHVLCDGGLSNRFNSLLFGLVLRQRFGGEWRISWPINNWCGAALDQLYRCEVPVDDATIEHYKEHERDHLLLMHDNQIGFAPENLVMNTGLESYADYAPHFATGRSIVYYNDTIPSFAGDEEIGKALSLLRPNADVERSAAEFCREHDIDHRVLGVHIRKTDFPENVDDEGIYQKVRATQQRCFVCSDSSEVLERFDALPHCVVFPKTSFPEKLADDAEWADWRKDEEGRWFPYNITRSSVAVVEAMIDQLILSQTTILATSHSSFQQTARLFQTHGFFLSPPRAASAPAAPRDRRAAETRLERRIRKWKSKLRRLVHGRERARTPDFEIPLIAHDASAPGVATSGPPVTQADLLELIDAIRPWKMSGDTKVRIGSAGDGGYVMPSSARRTNTVLSIGIGDETSFDDELAAQGARVLQFDHTIAAPPTSPPGCEFHRLGWGLRDEHPMITLPSMLKMIDWSDARHPILKFDVEGAEWDGLAMTPSSDLVRFETLAGEFHDFERLLERDFFERVKSVFAKLNETHRVVHLHPNNAGRLVLLEGVPMPRLLELTWARIDAFPLDGRSDEPIPGPLDSPNLPDLPDLQLRAF